VGKKKKNKGLRLVVRPQPRGEGKIGREKKRGNAVMQQNKKREEKKVDHVDAKGKRAKDSQLQA